MAPDTLVEVAAFVPVQSTLTYRVPANLSPLIRRGCRVLVPVGQRTVVGVVVSLDHLIGLGLAPMTVRKRIQFAKTIFRAAVRHKLVAADPFAEVTVQPTMPDRMQFVTQEETTKLLEACPSLDCSTTSDRRVRRNWPSGSPCTS